MLQFIIAITPIIIWAFAAWMALSQHYAMSDDTGKEHRNQFSAIVRWLGRIPAFAYICIYVIIIFLFAAIYISLPGRHFYHNTVKYEYGPLTEEANEILAQLESHIKNAFRDEYPLGIATHGDWVLDIELVEAHTLDVANFPEEISFLVSYRLEFLQEDHYAVAYNRIKVTAPIYGQSLFVDDMSYLVLQIQEQDHLKDFLPSSPNASILFPFRGFGGEGPTILPIPVELHARIMDFGQGYRGFPSSTRGHWARMLYFSAGVATSNALGDIVPLTSLARTLVTLEAIVAIIIIGLFLNSLGTMLISKSK